MQLGRYQVLKHLASGSVADVLLARASGLEGFARHVVIKRMRPELAQEEHFAKAFLDEARISASLNHQNIVQVHDIGEEGGAYYFAMEYVHGEDVRTVLNQVRERGENVPLEIAVAIIMAAASGLHHAHEKTGSKGEKLGIVHRDVSPSNILVGYDGSVKLVDFGLAKAAARSTQTLAGTIKGKASYMSPEQCKGETVDRRTDVFCLGIVLYELVTAQKLFKAATEFAIMQQVVEGEIPPPSRLRADVPPALDAIIMRALARDPNARYQTAEDLRAAVEGFAVSFELRTSNKALADYLTRLFGSRPEPWQTNEPRKVSDSTVELPGSRKGAVAPAASAKKAPVHYEDDDEDDGTFDDDNIATTVVPDEKAAIEAAKAAAAAKRVARPEHVDQSTVIEPPAFESESDTIAETTLDTGGDPRSMLAPLGKRPPADTVKSGTAKPPGVPYPANTRVTPPGGMPAVAPTGGARRDPSGISPPTRNTPPGTIEAATPARRDPSGVSARRDPSGIAPPNRNTPPNPYDAPGSARKASPNPYNAPGSTGPFQREEVPGYTGSTGPFQREDPDEVGTAPGGLPGEYPGGRKGNSPPGAFPGGRTGNSPPGGFSGGGNSPPSGFPGARTGNSPPGAFPGGRTGNSPPGAFPGGRTGNTPPGAFPRAGNTPAGAFKGTGSHPARTGKTPPGAFPRGGTTPGGYGSPDGVEATILGVGAAGPGAPPPQASGFKVWFAAYRSSILLGGGAGIVVVIILMIVMRLMS